MKFFEEKSFHVKALKINHHYSKRHHISYLDSPLAFWVKRNLLDNIIHVFSTFFFLSFLHSSFFISFILWIEFLCCLELSEIHRLWKLNFFLCRFGVCMQFIVYSTFWIDKSLSLNNDGNFHIDDVKHFSWIPSAQFQYPFWYLLSG